MARSQQTWNKLENEKKKLKKKKDKAVKKTERAANTKDGSDLDSMIAYVDEYGRITSTPPDPTAKSVIKVEDIELGVRKQDDEEVEEFRTGIVTFFNESKDYGFIRDMATQDSVFVHRNSLLEPITENNKVLFEIGMGFKGPMAVNVKIDR